MVQLRLSSIPTAWLVDPRMAIQLTPTRIKGSKYLLIPKDLAQLLEIDDESILNLTIEDSDKGQRLIYSIREKFAKSAEP